MTHSQNSEKQQSKPFSMGAGLTLQRDVLSIGDSLQEATSIAGTEGNDT